VKTHARWVPLRRSTHFVESEDVKLRRQGVDQASLDAEEERTTYWVNDLYQVARVERNAGWVQLNIRRRDGRPIFRDWRHFQRIKNELLGDECEAIELYPAESRLVDTTNKYHLWGTTDPNFRFPVGWTEREVSDRIKTDSAGLKQRKI
jgi:hypothetical protein